MTPSDLLERFAKTLKEDIGPEVGAEYARTQAFLGAVVLQKLAGELRHADRHADEQARDYDVLAADVTALLSGRETPRAVEVALAAFSSARDEASLSALIEALYAAKDTLGHDHFETVLARIRVTLRADLDRRMEYAQ
ncbi:MAG: hypothetical protein K0U93_29680 [Gammaproteobacteria bacterium]|nr:hypothetical protein [Gammaproteobacteria bacterium]